MKILVVEDDFLTRKILKNFLKEYGEVDIAIDGEEALEAFSIAVKDGTGYNVIFLDILMPKLDGQEVLKSIRKIEESNCIYGNKGVKIVMTTVLDDSQSIIKAFREQCEVYLIKPISPEEIINTLKKLELI